MYLALIAAVRLQLYVGQRPNKRMMELIQFYLSGIAELDELEVLLAAEIARVGRAKARVKKAGGGRGKTAGGAVRAEPYPKGRSDRRRNDHGMEWKTAGAFFCSPPAGTGSAATTANTTGRSPVLPAAPPPPLRGSGRILPD